MVLVFFYILQQSADVMKYTVEILVEIPLEDFIKKFDNHANMKYWQRGLESFEHLHGNPGQVGAQMILNYKFGNRKISLTETITKSKFPNVFHVNYDTKGLHNIQRNYFKTTPQNHTQWISENEFIPISFAMRMMTLLIPSGFKKQSMLYLTDFKNFAEKGITVQNA